MSRGYADCRYQAGTCIYFEGHDGEELGGGAPDWLLRCSYRLRSLCYGRTNLLQVTRLAVTDPRSKTPEYNMVYPLQMIAGTEQH